MTHNIIVIDNKYSDLNPVYFGYENCEKKHSFGPAIRTYWLIHYIISGCGIYKIKNKTHKVHTGEMFVIPPYEETYYEADSEDPWNYIWIGFTTNGNLPTQLPYIIKCPEASKIFIAMKNCENLTNARSAYLSAKLWDLFALLLETKNSTFDYVDNALECIHSEYMHDITVEEIAKRLNLDRTYFSVIFKRKVGVSPKQYLLNYRMNVAISLMNSNNASVSIIAHSVGYTDLYTFSKAFKRHFGISPTKYSKEQK